MFVMGIVAYVIAGALQYRRVCRIPKEEALKNAE
jgi:hypothetical protein